MNSLGRITLAVLVLAAVAGCAVAPPQSAAVATAAFSGGGQQCREFFSRVDEAVARAGMSDGMAARVEGFPQLRVNRFLAGYAQQQMSDAQFADWMNRLLELGEEGYAVELANLSAAEAAQLERGLQGFPGELQNAGAGVKICGARLNAAIFASAESRGELRAAARVPDEYATWQRVAGLYWLTRIPFAAGVRQWQSETRAIFEAPLSQLPVRGHLLSYEPPRAEKVPVAAMIRNARVSALGIPEFNSAEFDALFAAFAPAFVIDTASDADRPGMLGWQNGALPAVDIARPVVYRRVSYTRYRGRTLLQLNYSIWFPGRPLVSEWDLLGGYLDGLTWRVTLTPDGEPWVYDSIHNCGCYHQFFPAARAALKSRSDTLDETAFVPQTLPTMAPGERLSLRLESGTHYLQHIIVERGAGSGGLQYRFADDDSLRSQTMRNGERKSIFRADGIVPGTERGERYWFWPMGVPEPGAMRQWGRHATAFVGRRHFDDPGLLEKYFEMKP